MNAFVVAIAFILGSTTAFLFSSNSQHWDGLKVTWGPLPLSRYFKSMPRTSYAAWNDRFVNVSGCNATGPVRGSRYIKSGDKSLVLLYDVKGYIAGIQTVIPKGLPHDYPKKALVPPFVEMDDGYHLTAYFVPPSKICSTGRTSDEFQTEGTGTVLYIQTGPNPETDYMSVPLLEKDLPSTAWVKGKCFLTMGQHYWYNISKDMSCDNFFPVFAMYNGGKLNSFGWALGADLPSPHYEHPPSLLLKLFFKDPPTCLYNRGKLSTMHIYMTDSPGHNWC